MRRPRADRHHDLPDAGHPVRAPRGASTRGACWTACASSPASRRVGAISNLHLNPLSASSSDFNVDGFEPPDGSRRLHRGPGRGRPRVLRGGRHRDPPRAQLSQADRARTRNRAGEGPRQATKIWSRRTGDGFIRVQNGRRRHSTRTGSVRRLLSETRGTGISGPLMKERLSWMQSTPTEDDS